nr:lytic transglycosylase domain-containing protein [Oceanobacter mangrovi]
MPNPDPELRQALLSAVSSAESFPDRFDAEVWLMDMQSRLDQMKWIKLKSKAKRVEFLKHVHQEASRAGISPELVLAVIQVESAFDRFAVSRVGAQGYMQIMPFWKQEIGRDDDNLMAMATNLRYGCTILKHYLDKEKGNWIRALARYNGSLGRTVYPEKVMAAWEKYWFVNY